MNVHLKQYFPLKYKDHFYSIATYFCHSFFISNKTMELPIRKFEKFSKNIVENFKKRKTKIIVLVRNCGPKKGV